MIRRIKFAPDASRLATASADHTLSVLRTPLKRCAGDGAYLTGEHSRVGVGVEQACAKALSRLDA